MRPLVNTVGPLAATSANSIALSQTPGAGAAFTLNGALVAAGVATITPPAQVTLTFAANETGHNFTITGLDQGGNPVSETIAGTTAGAVTSVLTYSVVQSIVSVSAATGAITVGNIQAASSQWLRMDEWALPNVAIGCEVSGTVDYTVQHTFDDPNSPTSPVLPSAVHWQNCPDISAVGATGDVSVYYPFIPMWIRLVLNSGSGSVTITATQAGVTPK